jgi:hypothetical protein
MLSVPTGTLEDFVGSIAVDFGVVLIELRRTALVWPEELDSLDERRSDLDLESPED